MPQDLILSENFDLTFKNGDLATGESSEQHQALLILVEKGEIREYPAHGVGVYTWINDDLTGNLNSAIKKEFEADGMKVKGVRGTIDNLKVEAFYESD